jgi:serine phosphatase RsbU (regulator of sigma subunit)
VPLRADFADLRQRFDDFAGRFSERARPAAARPRHPDYWTSVQDLFTRDVTGQGLRDMFAGDSQDTVRYFARAVDLSDLESAPWYRRWPVAGWRVFLEMAFRLSPARRLLFAASVPLIVFGWAGYVLHWMIHDRSIFFSAPDLLLLGASALLFLLVLELRDKLTLKSDLEIARQIQFGLLPFEPYRRDGLAVDALMRPANTVGGDYFDLIELGGGRVAICIGDVAGKGMPAALLMALLQGSLRTLLTAGFRGPEAVGKLNEHLCANIPANRLVTLFYAEYDTATGELSYVNAGHNPPFVLAPDVYGRDQQLDPTGMALGVLPGTTYEARQVTLLSGDRLLLYTDGITEAEDPHGVEYGETRLRIYLETHRALANDALLYGVRDDVLAFCRQSRPRDDMTLMAVAREPAPLPS